MKLNLQAINKVRLLLIFVSSCLSWCLIVLHNSAYKLFCVYFAGFPGRLIPEDELESGWLDALD